MPTTPLDQSVQFLKGVGSSRAELLERLGIRTLRDLILHIPRSYDDLSDVRGMDQLQANVLQTVVGEVVEIDGKELNDGRKVATVVIADEKGKCLAGIWFNQMMIANRCRFGQKIAMSGKPRWFKDHWSMNHPRIEFMDEGAGPTRKILPVYPLTENLHPDKLREMIRLALESAGESMPDLVPESIRKKHGFSTMAATLWEVHFPEVLAQGLQARKRFIYEEFLVLQVALALRRREIRDRQQAPQLFTTKAIDAHIRKLIPFEFTDDQNRAARAIAKDLQSSRPMQRLLQADVGAGKTAVAVYGLLVAVANKHQAVLMAPTEVLARQHWRTLDQYLAQSRVRRALLTGGLPAKEKQQILDLLRMGEIDLIVGTQAIIQEGVQFAKLGLVVIDEQHKFGVDQRSKIRKLGADPHYLVMTATPIPRTIALAVFGDLDSSIMKQLPPGRQPVRTRWISEGQRETIHEEVRARLRQGKQAYVVCPLVEDSEALDLKSAEKHFEHLKENDFKDFRVGLLHGRLDDEAKERAMRMFRERELDLLVTTLVIEVGVDVPNATTMIIEHADRFGLSQLHQLRGRVSRGDVAGHCYLFAGVSTDDAKLRLRAMCRTSDGFELAEEDARLRGLGEFFGTRQHGIGTDLRFGDLLRDRDILDLARQDALELVGADGGLRLPEHALLRRAVIERYGQTLELAEVG